MFGPIDAKFSTSLNPREQASIKKNNLEQTPNIESFDKRSNKLNTALAVIVLAIGIPLVIGAKLITLPFTISVKIGKKIAAAGQSTMAMKFNRSIKNFIFEGSLQKKTKNTEPAQSSNFDVQLPEPKTQAKEKIVTMLSALKKYPDMLSRSDKANIKKMEFYRDTVGTGNLTLRDCQDIDNIHKELNFTLNFANFAEAFRTLDKNTIDQHPSLTTLSNETTINGNLDIKALKKTYKKMTSQQRKEINILVKKCEITNSIRNIKELLLTPLETDQHNIFMRRYNSLVGDNESKVHRVHTEIKKLEHEVKIAVKSTYTSALFDHIFNNSLDEIQKESLSKLILNDPVVMLNRDLNLTDMEFLPKLLSKEDWLELINLIRENRLIDSPKEEGKLIQYLFNENIKKINTADQEKIIDKIIDNLELFYYRNRADQILSKLIEFFSDEEIFEEGSEHDKLDQWNEKRTNGELFLSLQDCKYLEEAYIRNFGTEFRTQ